MKTAVIETGSKQYVVKAGEQIDIELINDKKAGDKITLKTLAIVDGDKSQFTGLKDISAKVVDEVRSDKVTSIRYKAKKRVNKVRGYKHRSLRVEVLDF